MTDDALPCGALLISICPPGSKVWCWTGVDGKALAAQSGESLSEMTKRVDEVSDLVKQIAKSSQQQREAIHGANSSISLIDRTMQQNMEELNRLHKDVAFFHVG